jgi:hypothetical protein
MSKRNYFVEDKTNIYIGCSTDLFVFLNVPSLDYVFDVRNLDLV